MYIYLFASIILGITCLLWMNYQTKKHLTKDKFVWMLLALMVPIPAVLLFYFTKIRNKPIAK